MIRKLEKLSCRYGAQMGRRNNIPEDMTTVGKLHLVRLKWIDGDYDEGYCYWGGGIGDNIYWAYGETASEQVEIFVRAKSRNEAKLKVMMECFAINSTNFYR